MFQVAMRQIEQYCVDNNLSIVGYYESPSVPRSSQVPSPFAEKVGEKLRDNCKEAFLFTNTWSSTATENKFDISPYIKAEVMISGNFLMVKTKIRAEKNGVYREIQ